MKLFFRYLSDRRVILLTYIGMVALFISTFFLYDVPFEVYGDALLFSGFLLILVTAVQYIRYRKQHLKLLNGKKAVRLYVQSRKSQCQLIEEDYERLLETLDRECREDVAASKQANYRLMDYYSMWSHQIKTPLAVLNLKMQENQLDHTVLKQELFKIDQYLDMMLQYLRLNHTETDFVFEEVDIDRLIKETVKKYATFFIYQGLSFSLEDTGQVIISDKKWLGFVLEQILLNAIKYTRQGGIKIYSNPNKPKELVIEDTGIGILQEDIDRVFEKGYTGYNGHNEQKATGLGLYMSREIMRKLGHQIYLTSEVGSGTKAWLNLSQHRYKME
ncbi:sensor histidine kinase [Enterococcus sp. BWM-S5]|uniref:histidine kinase n=1 Tax=Enterococcus larvae TaxID=2794352 RepID=A0ABS4CNU4_9ENTE|nr:sensor histidine kinase [Enterococcus larvae]MBP1047937.1 sensor histidine kinase [Enterococcus larvae]